MKLVITEKPSVAQSVAKVIGAKKRCDGYLEGGGYVVSWCVGHLVELSPPQAYDERGGMECEIGESEGSGDGRSSVLAELKSRTDQITPPKKSNQEEVL